MSRVHLLIIDPQCDFCDPAGSLFVKGADKDMERLSKMMIDHSDVITEISVTMDMHQRYHIASPLFWRNEAGQMPNIYTTITSQDFEAGRWRAANPEHAEWAIHYLKSLDKNGRYQLCIWPYHCVVGSRGNNIYDPICSALSAFQDKYFKSVDYIFKGICSFTEHYSALFADVPIPSDSRTLVNRNLLIALSEAETVLVAGEALSHCVANTLIDISEGLSRDLSKFILLEDTTSNVDGFRHLGDDFMHKARVMGMRVSNSVDFIGLI